MFNNKSRWNKIKKFKRYSELMHYCVENNPLLKYYTFFNLEPNTTQLKWNDINSHNNNEDVKRTLFNDWITSEKIINDNPHLNILQKSYVKINDNAHLDIPQSVHIEKNYIILKYKYKFFKIFINII